MKKSAIRIICFWLILIFTLNYVNNIFKVKYSDGIYCLVKFYELEDNTVDVLMLGSSHAFEDFNTGVLWKEYGMASFVLGGSAQPMWNTYYYLKEALKTQTPQLILLEGYTTIFSSEFIDDSRIIKNNYGLKWSMDKINSIKISTPEDRWSEFLLEYLQYHTRYTELSKADFFTNQGRPLYADWKGFGCNMETTPLEAMNVMQVTERGKMYEKTEAYYRMTIELAQANNIPILIVISPYAGINEWEQTIFNTAGDIAAEYNVPFINYNLLINDIGIDFSTDAADSAHLNYRGNQKYSYAVGAYIKENFSVADRRGDINYQTWQNHADYISAMIENQLLLETVDRNDIVEKILNPNYRLIISIDGTCLSNDTDLYSLFEALDVPTDNGENGIYYRDNNNNTIGNIGMGKTEEYLRLDSHDLCMRRNFNEADATYTNQTIIDNIEYKKVANGVNIVVYDTITQSVVDSFGINIDAEYRIVR